MEVNDKVKIIGSTRGMRGMVLAPFINREGVIFHLAKNADGSVHQYGIEVQFNNSKGGFTIYLFADEFQKAFIVGRVEPNGELQIFADEQSAEFNCEEWVVIYADNEKDALNVEKFEAAHDAWAKKS